MSESPVDITPKNGGSFPWRGQDADQFEREWNMKPVTLRGFFDHSKEIQVTKYNNGEKGVEIVTPFYTHVNDNEEVQAILVNRGWMAEDLKDWRYDKTQDNARVKGVLYRGDANTKYSMPNRPFLSQYRSTRPEELAVVNALNNE